MMVKEGNARQRDYSAWRDRLDKEQPTQALKAEQARKAASVLAEQARKDMTRRAANCAAQTRQREERRKAAAL